MAEYYKRVIVEEPKLLRHQADTEDTPDVYVRYEPAADVAPVVHGEWIDHGIRDWRCSECGEKIQKLRKVDGYCYDDKPNYCPQCGAKMDVLVCSEIECEPPYGDKSDCELYKNGYCGARWTEKGGRANEVD